MRVVFSLVLFLISANLGAQENPFHIPAQYVGLQFVKANGQDRNTFFLRNLVDIREDEETVVLDHFTDFENVWRNMARFDHQARWLSDSRAIRESEISTEENSFDEFMSLVKLNWWRIVESAKASETPEDLILLTADELAELEPQPKQRIWVGSFIYKGKNKEGRHIVEPVQLDAPVARAILDSSHRIPAFAKTAESDRVQSLSYTYAIEMMEGDGFDERRATRP